MLPVLPDRLFRSRVVKHDASPRFRDVDGRDQATEPGADDGDFLHLRTPFCVFRVSRARRETRLSPRGGLSRKGSETDVLADNFRRIIFVRLFLGMGEPVDDVVPL